MKILFVLISLLLLGCTKQMSNDEIIEKVKQCKDADLIALRIVDIHEITIDIQCAPK